MNLYKVSKDKKSMIIKKMVIISALMIPGFSALADANVTCTSGSTITNITLFGGAYTASNICGDNVTITTTGSKTIAGGSETNNTNGIYFAMNGPHPDFIFGNNLTVRVSGDFVDAIRTNGTQSSNGVFTVRTGENTVLTATGNNSNGINVAQSPNGQAGYGRVYIGASSSVTVANGTAVRVNLTSQSPFYNLAYIGSNATITAGGTGSNNANSVGYAVYAGNRDDVLTNGTAKGTHAVAIIDTGAAISTTGSNGHAVYANKGGVVQLLGGSVETSGTGADALRAEKKLTPGNDYNALGGKIELAGNITISVADTDNAYAIHTLGESSEISSSRTNYYVGTEDKLYDGSGTVLNSSAKTTSATSGIYNITGNIFAESGLIDLAMTDGSVFTGATKLGAYAYTDASSGAAIDPRGTINLNIGGAGSSWNMTASSEISDLTLDGSTLRYLPTLGDPTLQSSYKTLTVFGTYTGNGGTLHLNTYLDVSDSPSDLLIIKGPTATANGSSFLYIHNNGGGGAQTTGNGILVVSAVDGAQTQSGAFTLSNRVAAGAFEYQLFRGGVGSDANNQNWYLRNTAPLAPPPAPSNEIDPETKPTEESEIPLIRIEVPVDMVILPQAMEYGYAMLDTLHERVGETWLKPMDPAYEEKTVRGRNGKTQIIRVPVTTSNGANQTKLASSGWARLIGERGFRKNDNFFRHGADYSYTFSGLQAGLDLYGSEQANGTLDKAGIYVGIGQISSDVKGAFGSKAGSVDMDAYTVGAYWTHLEVSGWYTDAVLQGTWYSADAKSTYGQQIKPDGFGIIASMETGYAFKLGNNWMLEPQAQLAYQHVSFDSARDQFGLVSFDNGESLRARLGLRLSKTWNMADEVKPRLLTAWVRANVWHEFLGNTKTSFGNLDGQNMMPFHSDLGGTWGELGFGVSGQVTEGVSLFASGAYNHSLDNKGRETWNGRLGMTVKW